jgi:hypothetical protein
MKIKITWKDGSIDKMDTFFDEKGLKNLRTCIFEKFSSTVISLGDPPHTFYHLSEARKVEIYE